MAKKLREYTACWVRHEPDLEVGMIQIVPSELADVSVEITRASKYDPEASFSLIIRFCTAVNTNSDIDDRLLRYIVEALQVLIQDNELNLSLFGQNLGIKSKSHRSPKNRKRDKEIYFEVRESMFSMTYDNACVAVGKARFLSDETVKSIYKMRKKEHLEFLMEMDGYSHEVTSEDWTAIRMLLEKEQSDE